MKIVIADDHRLIVEAVVDKLSELGPGVTFVQAMSVPELLTSVTADVDLLLVDLVMPGAEGLSHVLEVRRRYPDVRVIVLSGQEDRELMREALEAGVMGFIPKAYSPAVMLSAVRLVLSGGVYVPPMMLTGMDLTPTRETPVAASHAPAPENRNEAPGGAGRNSMPQLRSVLTERQMNVLALLSEGKPNKLISRNLGISEGTVKIHLAAIFRALGVRNRTEAVVAARALENG
ncbi:MAG: response regulator transcription factor [Ottowia sp.]|uniref:response regulator n=1 Tax=unclassified Ottowia TaxID=2645081 RepID=UPI003C2E64FE